jgi:hypothetical protein
MPGWIYILIVKRFTRWQLGNGQQNPVGYVRHETVCTALSPKPPSMNNEQIKDSRIERVIALVQHDQVLDKLVGCTHVVWIIG